MDWIDISRPIRPGMEQWPGDPEVRLERIASLAGGDECNLTLLSLCVHAGTHVDAPLHYLEDAPAIDAMPLESGIGRARVLVVDGSRLVEAGELARHAPAAGERILLKGVHGRVRLGESAALQLASLRPRLVGVDSLSVGEEGEQGARVHRVLLAAGIWIVEGLDLSAVSAGDYELICLPLRIPGADGAPARALIRRISSR